MAEKNVEYPVPCPLVDDKRIPIYTCFAMHCVVDNETPNSLRRMRCERNRTFVRSARRAGITETIDTIRYPAVNRQKEKENE